MGFQSEHGATGILIHGSKSSRQTARVQAEAISKLQSLWIGKYSERFKEFIQGRKRMSSSECARLIVNIAFLKGATDPNFEGNTRVSSVSGYCHIISAEISGMRRLSSASKVIQDRISSLIRDGALINVIIEH